MRALVVAMLGFALLVVAPAAASADENACIEHVSSPQDIVYACTQDPTHGGGTSTISAGEHHVYTYEPVCGLGGASLCTSQSLCFVDGNEGLLFTVVRDGEPIGQSCLTDAKAEQQEVVTPGLVLRAFRRLDWPSSTLLIEPPGGRTLVNFATNFHTDNTHPSRQSVTLLGQRVTIEATPTTYTWHFGDGDTLDTDGPGDAYPALDITHDYTSKGDLAPSVDTTYSGRYRVGNGPWLTIPDTLTVDGAGIALTVTTARPTLVSP